MIKVFLFFIFFISTKSSTAQNQADNWYFGDMAGLNFSTCTPTVLSDGQINTQEGVATISDANGSLLFYTDGIKVWNKLHQVMANGTGLMGHPSSTQSAVIVPQPGSISIYYIFTTGMEQDTTGLRFCRVDMSLNGGLGDIIEKNTLLHRGVKEKVAAVMHANNTGIWIITRVFDTYQYQSWLVTASGISAAVVSLSPYNAGSGINTSIGYLKVSNDGKKLYCAFNNNRYSEMAKFNNQTGAVYDIFRFNNQPSTVTAPGRAGAYGVEFSPNNKYMYVTQRIVFDYFCSTCPGGNIYIYQYNVSNFDSAAIAGSAVLLDSSGAAGNSNTYSALQLAKNGKIYVAQHNSYYLGVINNPDMQSLACNFQADALRLNGNWCRHGLPTFIQSYFNPNYKSYDFTYTQDCNKNISFVLNTSFTYDSLRWDFGDAPSGAANSSVLAAPNHTYPANAVHTVNLYVFNKYGCVNKTDTITKQITVGLSRPNLGTDRAICEKDTASLNAFVNGATAYIWSTGETTPTITVTQPTVYWCEVTNAGCIFRDTVTISNKPVPIVQLGKDTSLCEGNNLLLNAANAGAAYLWNDGTATALYTVSREGSYNVAVNLNGCISSDTIVVSYKLKPVFTLGADKTICEGEQIILKPTVNASWLLLWNNGSSFNSYTILNPGNYLLTATNSCGSNTDDIKIEKGVCTIYIPNAFTPNSDGKNDNLKVLGTDAIDKFNFKIYNRYGQLVFETTDKYEGWNGKVKNVPAENGTYIYQLSYAETNSLKREYLQGSFILLR